jgi:KDO2-lipid IV(A) lauroyltransferase
MGVLYFLSDITAFIFGRLAKYRQKVIYNNARNSFPDYSEKQVREIVKKFYSHMADLIFESIKLFSISRDQVISRCKIRNPEVLDELYDQGKHVIIVGGHYNNWEMLAVALDSQVKHNIVGIYRPLTNKFFDKKFAASRSKYGTGLVHVKKVGKYFQNLDKSLKATVFGADQSPGTIRPNTYWTTFMNQETAVMFGTEKYATEYNLPVIYVSIDKIKRGYYEMEFSVLNLNPKESAYTEITEAHTRRLEEQILKNPEFYLWSHKRWKHKRQPDQ